MVASQDRPLLVLFCRIFSLLEHVGIMRDFIECSYLVSRDSLSDIMLAVCLLSWPGLRCTLLTLVIAVFSPLEAFRLWRSWNLEKEWAATWSEFRF